MNDLVSSIDELGYQNFDMSKYHIETQSIQSTKADHRLVRPVTMPIHLSTTYERAADGSYESDYVYSRNGNPNRTALESALATMEQGEVAFAFSSGMAAITSVLHCLKAGDHILLPDDVYYKLFQVMDQTFSRWNLTYSLVDMSDVAAVEAAVKPTTKLIWLETPSNPMLKITDIVAIANIATSKNILLAVDNTWATPVLLNPIVLGADVVVHSTTKYIGGHSDVLGGAVICKSKGELAEKLAQVQVGFGAVPSPFDCWLLARGLQTLSLRVRSQSTTAMALAQHLVLHPGIEAVHYPGLSTHKGHSKAQEQMQNGFGAMLSVQIKGSATEARAVCNALKLFTQATSLGGVESLVEHRKSVEGPQSHTPENLLRVSVGLEHIHDLAADWDQALSGLKLI